VIITIIIIIGFDSACDSISDKIALSIFHLNIHSLNKNCSDLYQFIQSVTLDFDALLVIFVLLEII